MRKIIDLYPEAPNEWVYRDHDLNVKREFFPSVSIRFEDMPEWHECETRYKEGYELLWSLRQEEHTEEERQAIEAQYAAWCASNPDLAPDIDASVPIKPEPSEPDADDGGSSVETDE